MRSKAHLGSPMMRPLAGGALVGYTGQVYVALKRIWKGQKSAA